MKRSKLYLMGLVGLSFFMATLVVAVGITNNPVQKFLVDSWAKGGRVQTCEDRGSASARNSCKEGRKEREEKLAQQAAWEAAQAAIVPNKLEVAETSFLSKIGNGNKVVEPVVKIPRAQVINEKEKIAAREIAAAAAEKAAKARAAEAAAKKIAAQIEARDKLEAQRLANEAKEIAVAAEAAQKAQAEQIRLEAIRIRDEKIAKAEIEAQRLANEKSKIAEREKAIAEIEAAAQVRAAAEKKVVEYAAPKSRQPINNPPNITLTDVIKVVSPGIAAIGGITDAIANKINEANTNPNTYNDCNSDTCNVIKTLAENSMQAISFDNFDEYVNSFSPDKVKTYWETHGYNSRSDCQSQFSGRAKGYCDQIDYTKEQTSSSVKLGTILTAEAYAVAVAPQIVAKAAAEHGVVAAGLQALGQAQVISTVYQTGDTVSYCVLNGWDPTCQQMTERQAINWGTMGVSEYANVANNALGRGANAVVSVTNLVVDTQDAGQAFKNPEGDTLTKAMTVFALAGDIGGMGLDWRAGQLPGAPRADVPDVPRVTATDDLAMAINSEGVSVADAAPAKTYKPAEGLTVTVTGDKVEISILGREPTTYSPGDEISRIEDITDIPNTATARLIIDKAENPFLLIDDQGLDIEVKQLNKNQNFSTTVKDTWDKWFNSGQHVANNQTAIDATLEILPRGASYQEITTVLINNGFHPDDINSDVLGDLWSRNLAQHLTPAEHAYNAVAASFRGQSPESATEIVTALRNEGYPETEINAAADDIFREVRDNDTTNTAPVVQAPVTRISNTDNIAANQEFLDLTAAAKQTILDSREPGIAMKTINPIIDDLIDQGVNRADAITLVASQISPPYAYTEEQAANLFLADRAAYNGTLEEKIACTAFLCKHNAELTDQIAYLRGEETYHVSYNLIDTQGQRVSGHSLTAIKLPSGDFAFIDSINNFTLYDVKDVLNFYKSEGLTATDATMYPVKYDVDGARLGSIANKNDVINLNDLVDNIPNSPIVPPPPESAPTQNWLEKYIRSADKTLFPALLAPTTITPTRRTMTSILDSYDQYASSLQEAISLSRKGKTEMEQSFEILKTLTEEKGVTIKLIDDEFVEVFENGKKTSMQLMGDNTARISFDGTILYVRQHPQFSNLPTNLEDVIHDTGAILTNGKIVPDGMMPSFTRQDLANFGLSQSDIDNLIDQDTNTVSTTHLFDDLISGKVSRESFSIVPSLTTPKSSFWSDNPVARRVLFFGSGLVIGAGAVTLSALTFINNTLSRAGLPNLPTFTPTNIPAGQEETVTPQLPTFTVTPTNTTFPPTITPEATLYPGQITVNSAPTNALKIAAIFEQAVRDFEASNQTKDSATFFEYLKTTFGQYDSRLLNDKDFMYSLEKTAELYGLEPGKAVSCVSGGVFYRGIPGSNMPNLEDYPLQLDSTGPGAYTIFDLIAKEGGNSGKIFNNKFENYRPTENLKVNVGENMAYRFIDSDFLYPGDALFSGIHVRAILDIEINPADNSRVFYIAESNNPQSETGIPNGLPEVKKLTEAEFLALYGGNLNKVVVLRKMGDYKNPYDPFRDTLPGDFFPTEIQTAN